MTDSTTSAASAETAPRRVAVVGLGNMGGPMAANLVKAGHQVTGFDRIAELAYRPPLVARDAG